MMQNKTKVYLAVLLALFLNHGISLAQNNPEQWVMYGSTNDFDAFYDKANIVRHPEGLILVLVKTVYTDKRAQEIASAVNINTPVKYSIGIHGFDCSMNAFRLFSTTYYSSDFSVLNKVKEKPVFSTPKNGSIAESLMNIVCAKMNSIPSGKPATQSAPKKKQKEDKDYFK